MAGYNTVSEILYLRKRAILVPRTRPRTEQLIRARRLHDLGLAHMIHPGQMHGRLLAERVIWSLESPEPLDSGLEFRAAQQLAREIRGTEAEKDEIQSLRSASATAPLVAEAV
jgi:predicted glycosyltransferase